MDLGVFTEGLETPMVDQDDYAPDKKNLFDVVNVLFTKESIPNTTVTNFLVVKAISQDFLLLHKAVILSRFIELDQKLFFKILYGYLPKRDNGFGFHKWVKKTSQENEDLLKPVAKYFHCSIYEAKNILEIFEHEQIEVNVVRSFFGLDRSKK